LTTKIEHLLTYVHEQPISGVACAELFMTTAADYKGDRRSSFQRIQAHPMSNDNAIAVGNPK
jgi:hypothetical protein